MLSVFLFYPFHTRLVPKTVILIYIRKKAKNHNILWFFKNCAVLSRPNAPERYSGRRLLQSSLMAHNAVCLVLLPSSPDTVHNASLHKTLVSTPRTPVPASHTPASKGHLGPAKADCGLQGTASSPLSTVKAL